MSSVCSQCNASHDPFSACPRCAPRFPPQAQRGPGSVREVALRWQHSPWGRILIGLLLTQGLFYGLRHLLTGVLLAAGEWESAEEAWSSGRGVVLLLSIQALALLLGGAIAGVGQRYGVVLGAVIGVWNGVLSAILNQGPAPGAIAIHLYAQPFLHAFCAAIGGCVSSFIWRPLPTQEAAALPGPARKARPRRTVPWFVGRVAWVRVVLGTALAVAGTLLAMPIFERVLVLGGGQLGTTTEVQDKIITWEIKALAMLLGAALAGATTPNGLKQGLFVGLFSGFVLVTLKSHTASNWVEFVLLTFVSTVSLSFAGSWFGGQLFPPVVKVPTKHRIADA